MFEMFSKKGFKIDAVRGGGVVWYMMEIDVDKYLVYFFMNLPPIYNFQMMMIKMKTFCSC